MVSFDEASWLRCVLLFCYDSKCSKQIYFWISCYRIATSRTSRWELASFLRLLTVIKLISLRRALQHCARTTTLNHFSLCNRMRSSKIIQIRITSWSQCLKMLEKLNTHCTRPQSIEMEEKSKQNRQTGGECKWDHQATSFRVVSAVFRDSIQLCDHSASV